MLRFHSLVLLSKCPENNDLSTIWRQVGGQAGPTARNASGLHAACSWTTLWPFRRIVSHRPRWSRATSASDVTTRHQCALGVAPAGACAQGCGLVAIAARGSALPQCRPRWARSSVASPCSRAAIQDMPPICGAGSIGRCFSPLRARASYRGQVRPPCVDRAGLFGRHPFVGMIAGTKRTAACHREPHQRVVIAASVLNTGSFEIRVRFSLSA